MVSQSRFLPPLCFKLLSLCHFVVQHSMAMCLETGHFVAMWQTLQLYNTPRWTVPEKQGR